jgi:hypothetical protein
MEVHGKFTAHLDDLEVMQLGHVEAHFIDLLETVPLWILPNEVFVFPQLPEVVVNSLVRLIEVDGGIEHHDDGSATAQLSLDIGLDAGYSLPEVIICSDFEHIPETSVIHHIDHFMTPTLLTSLFWLLLSI